MTIIFMKVTTATTMMIEPAVLIPLLAGCTLALFAPVIGTFTVIRRYSLMADTLAHVTLLGVALGLVFQSWAGVMPFIVAVAAAIFLEYLREFRRVSGDSALAMLLTVGLAASIVIASAAGKEIPEDALFGSLEAVTAGDLGRLIALGIAVAVIFILFWKEMVYSSFDEETARVQGIPVRAMNMTLVIMASLTVAFAIRAIGVLLVGSLMIIPANAALQLGKSFRQTVLWSVVFSLISVIVGFGLSHYYGANFGGSVVLSAFVCFIIAMAARRSRAWPRVRA
jgi:zinc transport system permease protein